MTWYYLNESGEVAGPVSEEDLKKMTAAGTLTDASQICREGTDAWVSLTEGLRMDARGGGTEVADLDEISAEDIEAGNAAGEPNTHSDEDQKEELKQSFADRIKSGAKETWADIKRTSRKAAIHAQIEKLKNVDLRKALFALGEKCYESGILQEELQEQFQQIRDLDATIAGKREASVAEADENKIATLKRVGIDAAKASHAQALILKRQHLLAHLGQSAFLVRKSGNCSGLEAEMEAIETIENGIRQMESGAEDFEAKKEIINKDASEDFSIRSAVPLFVCCLGFGWVMTWLLPMRGFPPELGFASLAGVLLLAVPSVLIAFLAMTRFLGYPRREWGKLIGALLFTMFAGMAILFLFQSIANASQAIDTRYYGKGTPFILGTKLIGWLEPYRFDGNIFLRLLASIFHTGFCEEVTKLLPLFLIVILNRKKPGRPLLRGFLMIALFSGLGFGITEALLFYAPWAGNPALESNVIRWYACVPLHAIYTVVDAAILWLLVPSFKNAKGNSAIGILLVAALAIAVVHGLYNTLSSLHNLVGITLDGFAIVLMIWLVRHCASLERANELTEDQVQLTPTLPGWLETRNGHQPAFGRLYSVAIASLLVSILCSFSTPRLSSPAEVTAETKSSSVDLGQMSREIEQEFRRIFPHARYSDIDNEYGDMVEFANEMIHAANSMVDIYPEHEGELRQWRNLVKKMQAYDRIKRQNQ